MRKTVTLTVYFLVKIIVAKTIVADAQSSSRMVIWFIYLLNAKSYDLRVVNTGYALLARLQDSPVQNMYIKA